MKLILFIVLVGLFGCTDHLYVHQVCDTLKVEVVDTLIQWEPAIHVDTSKFYGDTLRRVWVQMGEGGEWVPFTNK